MPRNANISLKIVALRFKLLSSYRCDERDGVDIGDVASCEVRDKGLLSGFVAWIHIELGVSDLVK